ncbi:MAG: bifunctional UDP-sugar hydrolase/5'-nucleotidase [Anaerolineales bacterium]|jgi:5'-nucleotidase/UDP-sugar diphosphatase
MKKHRGRIVSVFFAILILAACTPATSVQQTPVGSSSSTPLTSTNVENLTILYTNDEHGWMEGESKGSGAANLLGLWRPKEGYKPQSDFLILSGGDNWTGPAISTWFKGQSMVEVMNAMGYAASTIGNHEFDFGLQNLKQRAAEAQFPYLSANIVYKKSGKVPEDLGIQPYTILSAGDLKVGVIGLTTRQTPDITNPNVTGGLEFEDYASVLRQYVPQIRNAGADVIVVTGHVCISELQTLAPQVEDLRIAMFAGGHCHKIYQGKDGDAVIVEAGSDYRDYAVVQLTIDVNSYQVLQSEYAVNKNQGGATNQAVQAVVDRWNDRAQSELNQTIGYLKKTLSKGGSEEQSLATETWLLAYPSAQVALTNLGGFRDRLPAGEVTLADITSVFPFDNVLVDVALTGDQLNQVIKEAPFSTSIGGIHKKNGQWVFNSNSEPLDPKATYHVLVNDFMYAGGDNYKLLAQFDPQAYNTSIDWRQPIIDWIKTQNSTPNHPLDTAIAELGH